MATLIYDPYGIESVITTAVLLKEQPETFTGAVAFNGEMVPSTEDTFLRVLCELDEQTLSRFSKLGKSIMVFDVEEMLLKEAENSEEEAVDDGVQYSLLRHIYRSNPSDELYRLILAVDFFKKRNRSHYAEMYTDGKPVEYINIGFMLHARVYWAFKQALTTLFTAKKFEYSDAEHVEEYTEFQSMLKGNMKQYLSVSNVELSGKRLTIPMMNTNIGEAAWLKQYLQAVYPYGILYEVKGLSIIAITWSPERNMEKKFSMLLKEAISKEYRVVFAGRD